MDLPRRAESSVLCFAAESRGSAGLSLKAKGLADS